MKCGKKRHPKKKKVLFYGALFMAWIISDYFCVPLQYFFPSEPHYFRCILWLACTDKTWIPFVLFKTPGSGVSILSSKWVLQKQIFRKICHKNVSPAKTCIHSVSHMQNKTFLFLLKMFVSPVNCRKKWLRWTHEILKKKEVLQFNLLTSNLKVNSFKLPF